jgi:FAD/FMN-containing dehydrogenase
MQARLHDTSGTDLPATNWSGSVPFRATQWVPESEEALSRIVRTTRERGGVIRAIGAGHSSSAPLLSSDDTLIRTTALAGIQRVDASTREAWVGAGTTLDELGHELLKKKLGLCNYGDVDVQTIGGAIATGTHGSGRRLRNLATLLIGARIVTGTGEVREFSIERDPQVIRGLRVSLGALGICTSLRLELEEAYQLHRREWCLPFEPAMAQFDAIADICRNVDMYWYPRSDEVKLRTLDFPGKVPGHVESAKLKKEECGWAADVLPRTRELKFEELEYALPAAAGPACMRTVRDRVKARHRREVAWRVLYRTVAADDAYLSPAHDRDIVTISLHHNAGLPYQAYFSDIEPIFRAHDGRPHWAKKHSLTADALRQLYPKWDDFMSLRQQLDPDDVFLSPGMRSLLRK